MDYRANKIAIVGMGNVGATTAFALLIEGGVNELVLVSRTLDKAVGEQLDLEHTLPFVDHATVLATDDYHKLEGADIVVITAGAAQKPGQTRLDLVRENVAMIDEIMPKVQQYAPEAVVLIVSNPVDVLTFKACQIANDFSGRVFGSGTLLDTARFRFHLSEFFGVHPRSIHAYVLGEHGDSAFPAVAGATIGGQKLTAFPQYSTEKVAEAFEKTRKAAYAIIQAKGATYYAIGMAIVRLVQAITRNAQSVMPVSVPLTDYYGISGVALSVPCVVGKNGVERILAVELSEEEKAQLATSAARLKEFSV